MRMLASVFMLCVLLAAAGRPALAQQSCKVCAEQQKACMKNYAGPTCSSEYRMCMKSCRSSK
jgi:hypothetical protein